MTRKGLLVTIIILSFLTIGCEGVASNKVIKQVNSPDKKFAAYAFIRSAGATTSFSPQVSIVPYDKKLPNEPGNLFIGNHSDYIDVKWKDETNLLVMFDGDVSNIFKKKTSYKGIHIIYIEED